MDTIVERTLIANGIFQSPGSNQLQCLICTTNANFVDWKKHIEESMHTGTLKCFKLSFSLSNERIKCKICKACFHWIMLEAHAKLHKIVPWYMPLDRYKIFYENHILEWEKQFYCYPCDTFFPEWSTAFTHINNERHKNLVKMEVPSNDLSCWNKVDIPYELLVNEGFVTWGATTFKCIICNRPKIGLKNVHQHVSGDQHGHLKIRFIRELRDWKNSKINGQISNQVAPLPIQPCMYVIQNSPSLYNCKICNIELFDHSSVDNHVTEMTHANALKKYGCKNIFVKDKDYYCECCNCLILGISNILLHVKGTRHRNNMSIVGMKKEKVIISNRLPVERESKKKCNYEADCLPSDYIVLLDHGKFCKICNCTIDSRDSDDHIAGEGHLTSMKEFRKNVTMTENYTEYRCKCCNCRILGIDNLFLHLNGSRHANCISKRGRQKEVGSDEISTIDDKEIDVEEIPGIEKNPPKYVAVNLCYDHILKIDDNNSCCKICDCKISQSDIDAHIIGNEHEIAVQEFCGSVTLVKNDKYRCKDCNCTIRGISNVYLHIHGYRHRKDENEYPGEEKNSGCMKKVTKSVELNKKESKPEEKMNSYESLNQTLENKRNNIPEALIVGNDNASNSETGYKSSNDKKDEEIADHSSEADNEQVNGVSHDDNMNNVIPKLKSYNLDLGTFLTLDSDPENFPSSMSESINGRKRILMYKANTQRVLQLLNFDEDYIHNMRDKLKEVEQGMKLCFANALKKIYCMICRKEVAEKLDNYIEHLWSLDHCEYLEGMEKDHDLFELLPDQYSELDLASHYMEEISEDAIICHACDKELDNVNYALRDHTTDKIHVRNCEEMHLRARQNFEATKSRIQCDWYNIYSYQCVPCSVNSESEFTFANHLKSPGHERIINNLENNDRGLIYDFCATCGILWYGNRCTYANHQEMVHKSLIIRDGEKKSIEFLVPTSVKYIRYAIEHFYEASTDGRKKKEKKIIRDVENGLSIEDKKIIIFFENCFPSCGKLLLLLEQWLIMSGLSGSERITTYALYWYMIFFLQRESIVPSVAALKTGMDELIPGWEKEEPHNVTYNDAKENFGIDKFFIRFFTFYANFDYRYDVACPLLGELMKKRAFVDTENHLEEMESYIAYLKQSDNPEPLQIESPMCLQDPFDLCANLTKSLDKVELNRFRTCCAKALNALSINL